MKNEIQTQPQADTLEGKEWKTRRKGDISIFDPSIIRRAIPDSFKKLDPRVQVKNPVMFVVEVGSVVTTIEFIRLLFTQPSAGFTRGQLTAVTMCTLALTIWLWFTIVFADLAAALAEAPGHAPAATLRHAHTT